MLKNKFLPLLVLSLAMVLSMGMIAGCSGSSDEEVIRNSLTEELDGIKSMDDAFVSDLASSMDVTELSDYGIDGVEFMRSYLDGFDYRIEDVSVDGDTAEAVVVLICKSFSGYEDALTAAAEQLRSNPQELLSLSEDEQKARLGQMVMDALSQVPTAETDPIVITYAKSGNTWQPDASAETDITSAMLTN